MKIGITSISSTGVVTIPKEIRRKLRLRSGSQLAVFTDGKDILLKRILTPKKVSASINKSLSS